MPCEESGIEMEVSVYDISSEGQKLIAKPCLKTEVGKTATVCVTEKCDDGSEESIKITIESTATEESCVNVDVKE